METAIKSNAGLLEGEKLYLERARIALPILVRQAQAGQKIYYSDLAEEMEMPNPRNLNYVLGAIGNALQLIGEEWGEKIPPIQCLVLNRQTDLPGDGISWFIENKESFLNSPKQIKRQIVGEMLSEIFLYQKWEEVLAFLELEPLEMDFSAMIEKLRYYGGMGKGESESHRNFKEWVFNNPTSLNLDNKVIPVKMEYLFPSQDAIDIAFRSKDFFVGVEVKSKISNDSDILRGVFQCIKYDALIRAEQTLTKKPLSCRVILALEGSFPKFLIPIKNQLGVEVLDNVRMNIQMKN